MPLLADIPTRGYNYTLRSLLPLGLERDLQHSCTLAVHEAVVTLLVVHHPPNLGLALTVLVDGESSRVRVVVEAEVGVCDGGDAEGLVGVVEEGHSLAAGHRLAGLVVTKHSVRNNCI